MEREPMEDVPSETPETPPSEQEPFARLSAFEQTRLRIQQLEESPPSPQQQERLREAYELRNQFLEEARNQGLLVDVEFDLDGIYESISPVLRLDSNKARAILRQSSMSIPENNFWSQTRYAPLRPRFAGAREFFFKQGLNRIDDRILSEAGVTVPPEAELPWEWKIGEAETRITERERRAEEERRKGLLWERHLGYIVLHANTTQELKDAVEQFLSATESETSQFDAKDILGDSDQLGRQITEIGRKVKMDEKERLQLRKEAEGRLLIYAANWFIVKGLVEYWGQIMDLFSKHGMERLSAVSRAYEGRVMLATYYLEHIETFRRYFRPQTDDRLLGKWVAQAQVRDEVKNRLFYAIFNTALKRPEELGLQNRQEVLEKVGIDQSEADFLNLFNINNLQITQTELIDEQGRVIENPEVKQFIQAGNDLKDKKKRIEEAVVNRRPISEQLTKEEEDQLKKIDDAEKAVNVAIMVLTDFGVSSEVGAPCIRTRVDQQERKGELVSIEDAIRALRFVRDSYEKRNNLDKIVYNIIESETDAERYSRVENERQRRRNLIGDLMAQTLGDIKTFGYDAKFQNENGNEVTLRDVLKEDWLDPQYNYYIAFDHKLRSAFFDDYYHQESSPISGQLARIKRTLERRGLIKAQPANQTEEQMGLLHAMEALRRDYFEDEELIYETFLKNAEEMVHGLTNLPFGLKRIYYPSTAIRLDQENIVIRGKDMLPYLSAQHRNLARELGVDFRGLIALFERKKAKSVVNGEEKESELKDLEGTIGDSYEIERWVKRTIAAQRMRVFLIGGTLDEKEVIRGLLQSPAKDVRKLSISATEERQVVKKYEFFGDRNAYYEQAYENVKDVLSRALAFCLGFVGTTGSDRVQGIRSAKWAGDKAFENIINWFIKTKEGQDSYKYEVNTLKTLMEWEREWFMEGRGKPTLLNEIKRREFPPI